VSIVQNLVVKTLKHFDNVISTCCKNVVEVFESLTTSQDNASFLLCLEWDVIYIYININNINILLSSPLSQRRGHNTSPDNTIGDEINLDKNIEKVRGKIYATGIVPAGNRLKLV
jgi:hypothetical protein